MAAKKAKAKAEAVDPKVTAKLDQHAHEINVRFEKAAALDGKADDHRLAAALRLAEAKKLCDENGVKFKAWTGEHVQQKYETVRKLVAIGFAPDPAKALADMREGNRQANAELRQRRQAPALDHRPGVEGNELGADGGSLPEIPTLEGVDALKAAFDLLRASEKMEFMQYAAEQTGVALDTGFAGAEDHPFTQAARQVAGEVVPGNDQIEDPRERKRKRA